MNVNTIIISSGTGINSASKNYAKIDGAKIIQLIAVPKLRAVKIIGFTVSEVTFSLFSLTFQLVLNEDLLVCYWLITSEIILCLSFL